VKQSITLTCSGTVPIIHGDEFFMPKHLCPLVAFTSTPKDTAFCQLSLKEDEIGEYIVAWNGTRANDPFMTHTPATTTNVPSYAGSIASQSSKDTQNGHLELEANDLLPSNHSIKTTFSVASTLHEGGRTKVFTISGPNTDCDEAVNFVRMFQALKETSMCDVEAVAKNLGIMSIHGHEAKSDTDSEGGGAPLSRQTSGQQSDGGVALVPKFEYIEDLAPPHSHLVTNIDTLKAEYGELINAMKEQVREFFIQSAASCHTEKLKLPKMVIIESFLLLSDPAIISLGDSNPNTTRLLQVFHTFLQKMQYLSTRLADRGDIDEELEQEREGHEKNIQTINGVCKRGMMERFHCKLWLSTSEHAAKSRRFERAAYLDRSEGGLREPGQLWKTEGYFDQITWTNHLDSHKWLIGEDGGDEIVSELGAYKAGIHLRAQDLRVEDTVRWAVGITLDEMKKLSGLGEKEDSGKVACRGCDGCGGNAREW
jgi:hypothetical protein